jgi:hypothetical protein
MQSFPRKRESILQAVGNAPAKDWIPAFAGMTGASKGTRFQMTPLLTFESHFLSNLLESLAEFHHAKNRLS